MVSLFKDSSQISIDSKYTLYLNKKIGNGAFGDVYQGINISTLSKVAIKVEKRKTEHPQLKKEYYILNYLKGGEGIPNVYYFLQCNDFNCLVMDYLGPNLEAILTKFNRHMPIATVISYGIQILQRIEYIHKLHIIHRDIKPQNFVIGKQGIIYLIDFGLSKRFRDPKTGAHIPYKDGKQLTGTARYASIYTHLGIEQSRRDDLESMIYTLIYLHKGSLPWAELHSKSKSEKYQKILETKINISEDVLLKDMPKEFHDILSYIRNLQFEEKPNYSFIKESFISVIKSINRTENKNMYDNSAILLSMKE